MLPTSKANLNQFIQFLDKPFKLVPIAMGRHDYKTAKKVGENLFENSLIKLSDNSYTEMQFRKITYNVGLPDSIFSERSLRTPPKKWLK